MNEEPIVGRNDAISLDMFTTLLYNDMIRNPSKDNRSIVMTENKRKNHARLLEYWREFDPEKYEKALRIYEAMSQLAEDVKGIRDFETRRRDGMSLQDNLRVYLDRDSEYHFDSLDNPTAILDYQMSRFKEISLQEKYGEALTMVKGKAEYYIERRGRSDTLENTNGQEIKIEQVGILYYRDWRTIEDLLPCYEITKMQEGEEKTFRIFSRINFDKLDDPEYAGLVAEELLSDDNILFHNYGGYIGQIEDYSLAYETAIPVYTQAEKAEGDPLKDPKYCIEFEDTSISAAKLLERQRRKQIDKEANGLDSDEEQR